MSAVMPGLPRLLPTPSSSYLVPTIHPSYLLRQGKPISDVILHDLARAKRLADGGDPILPENIVVALPSNPMGLEATVRAAKGWMERWRNLRCNVGVDVETGSLKYMSARLYSIALAGADGQGTAVSFTLRDLHTLPYEAERVLEDEMRLLLQDARVPKVMHNRPFDDSVLRIRGYMVEGPILDTQGLHHLVQPDIEHDLGSIGHTYLDTEPWKLGDEGGKLATTQDVVTLLVYNAKDAHRTVLLADPLIREIYERYENAKPAELMSYQMAFAGLASRMQQRGIPVNMELRARKGEQLQVEIAEHRRQMQKFLDDRGTPWPDFDPDKRAHLVDVLYGKKYLNLEPTRYTPKSNEPGVSYKDIIDHMEHPFVYNLTQYVEKRVLYTKLYAQYTKAGGLTKFAKSLHSDNRAHVSWNPNGQKGSRFASSPNVQNDPPAHREIYEAPEGYAIVAADKDQLELRIIACRAGVQELINEIRKPNGDPHSLAARNIYGAEFERANPDKRKQLRNMVKNVVYASLYNAGPDTVYRTVRSKKQLDAKTRALLTPDQVRFIHKSFFGRFVEIPEYHEANMRLASNPPYFNECMPLLRRRYFPVQPPPFTEVGNWVTQTEGSDWVGIEMVLIQEELDKKCPGAEIILHGHDAIFIETPIRFAEQVRGIVNRLFGKTKIEGPAGEVYLTAEADIGKNVYRAQYLKGTPANQMWNGSGFGLAA